MNSRIRSTLATLALSLSILTALAAFSRPASAQTSTLDIVQYVGGDLGSVCDPDKATENGFYYGLYGGTCCGSPGHVACVRPSGRTVEQYCLSGFTRKKDPFSGETFCAGNAAVPEEANLLPQARPAAGTDFTFYATSDLHFYRNVFDLPMQMSHPGNMNTFPLAKFNWPGGAGIAPQPIQAPTAIVIPGDITTCLAGAAEVDSLRLAWERSSIPGSTWFPVYFGLGNHDMIRAGSAGCDDTASAARVWSYLYTRMHNLRGDHNGSGCLIGVDTGCTDNGTGEGSQNYSWDWHGVHMVMLNTWAGEQNHTVPLTSAGLTWLEKDLSWNVGTSNRPVIFFQHYTMYDVAADNNISGSKYWLQSDYHNFWNIIRNYNVVGLFSGHTHSLGTERAATAASDSGSTNQDGSKILNYWGPASGDLPKPGADRFASKLMRWDTPFIDNFIDGNGGLCGDDLCSGSNNGSANFLAVHVTDHYIDVTAITEHESDSVLVGDPKMNFAYGAKACHKRINSPYTPFAGVVRHVIGPQYSYTNNTGAPIVGAFAATHLNLSTPDFVDTCTGDKWQDNAGNNFNIANGYRMVVDDGETLQPGATKYFILFDTPDPANVGLVLLHDTVVVSLSTLKAGSDAKITLPISTRLGQHSTYTTTTDAQWLKAMPQGEFSAPLLIGVISAPPNVTGHVTITPRDTQIPPFVITVLTEDPKITITSNPKGATVYVDTVPYTTPAVFFWAPASVHAIDAGKASLLPGIKQTFTGWTDGGTPLLSYTVGDSDATLNANMNFSYLLTLPRTSGGTLAVSPSSADGYYASDASIRFTASPAAGNFFAGFGGGLSGTTNPQSLTITRPISVSANFAPIPLTTIQTTPASHATINVDGSDTIAPVQVSWMPGSSHTLAMNAQVFGPGERYIFSSWGDGSTVNPLTVVASTLSQTLSINILRQEFLNVSAVPAEGGSVTGGGWQNRGDSVAVSATPAAGYVFTGFTGAITSSSSPASTTVAGPVAIYANFVKAQP